MSSLATVHKHISNLEEKGLVKRGYNQSRSIDVLPPRGRMKQFMGLNSTATMVPLYGRIGASQPFESVEQPPEELRFSDFTKSSQEVFAVEVSGDSMQDEGILDHDYVLVEKTKTARNGEIVLALVGNEENTLKRFYKEGDKVRLQPSNATMKPIIVPAESVEIQGRVIAVLRKY